MVPAAIVFRNSCGGFRLDRDGDVKRLPPGWVAARTGGTGHRYGADLRIERNRPGRITLLRRGRIVWRSSDRYRNDAGSVAFGRQAFAFASFKRGIFVTDLRGPERLLVRGVGLDPLAFLRDGSLLVVEYGSGSSIRVVAPNGVVVRRHRLRQQNGYAFDERTESLFFVTPGRTLVRAEGTAVHFVRPLRDLDGWISFAGRYLTLSDFAHRGPSDEIRFTVLERDGRLISRCWRSPKKARIDIGPVASADGRTFAFRTVTRPRSGTVVLYVLREGEERATPVYQHRGGRVGCGVNAGFGWHRRFLLYASTDGPAAIVDVRDGSVRSLTELASRLPRRIPGERPAAYWLSDFVRP